MRTLKKIAAVLALATVVAAGAPRVTFAGAAPAPPVNRCTDFAVPAVSLRAV